MNQKILYIVTKSNLGGAQKYVLTLADEAKKQNGVLVAAGGNSELFEHLKEKNIEAVSIPSLQRDISFIKEIRAFFFLLSLIQKEKPNVVHLSSPKAGGLGALAARIAGVKKIIYTAHGWSFYEDVSWINKLFRRLTSYVIALLSHNVVAVSKRDLRAFNGWPFASKKVTLIYNGVAQEGTLEKKEARAKLAIDYNIPESPCMIATVAELHNNKGLAYLVRAMRHIENASLVVFGEGEERKNLETLIEKYDLYYRVFLPGFVPNAPRLLSGFDIFALPSTKEGLPFALLEAGALGVPVVATNIGGLPDVIEHEKNGLLVDPKDEKALTAALNTLCADSDLRTHYGAEIKRTIEVDFSTKQMVEKTFALYT